ncbi:hypothetical protein SAMN02745121_08527 [Nannocystis exedens]|uniref:Uncharacterized protein n=1 Tax=Nannocystis exedens TaxID=54 RepID=A0A1I2IAB8_9BACT|nr:hypothetical protein NAEX_06075 [Nannocystis exedens]SFF38603.1 hypothetical protein SAMN02745121_08527 [Nannocystis exedens]
MVVFRLSKYPGCESAPNFWRFQPGSTRGASLGAGPAVRRRTTDRYLAPPTP